MQHRYVDLVAEYPERFALFLDQRENKYIINKKEDIDATERRYPDGSLWVADSRLSVFEFNDKFGTKIFFDRKNQFGIFKFAEIDIIMHKGVIKIESDEIRLTASKILHLVGKKMLSVITQVFQMLTSVNSVMSRDRQDSSK